MAYWLDPPDLLSLLPSTSYDDLPKCGVTHSGVGWVLPHLTSRQYPADLPTGQSHVGIFSIKISSFQMTQACGKLTKKKKQGSRGPRLNKKEGQKEKMNWEPPCLSFCSLKADVVWTVISPSCHHAFPALMDYRNLNPSFSPFITSLRHFMTVMREVTNASSLHLFQNTSSLDFVGFFVFFLN